MGITFFQEWEVEMGNCSICGTRHPNPFDNSCIQKINNQNAEIVNQIQKILDLDVGWSSPRVLKDTLQDMITKIKSQKQDSVM